MAKRKEDAPKAGSPAWMATFSDLMNLLLCFFVLLFASSTIDAEKLEQVAASFAKDNIFQAGSTAIGDGQMMSQGVKQIAALDNYVQSLGRNQKGETTNLSDVKSESDKVVDAASTTAEKVQDHVNETTETTELGSASTQNGEGQSQTQSDEAKQNQAESAEQSEESLEKQVKETGYEQSEAMNAEIEKMLKSSKISDRVSLSYTAQYVELSLNGGLLFESGAAELTGEAERLMNKVGDILEKYRKRTIEIEGHTDNVPAGGEYKDNQYLSAARAISVYEYLLDHKNLIARNMKHSGYGDSRPKASNDTVKGRAKNRRVEIKIFNKISSETDD